MNLPAPVTLREFCNSALNSIDSAESFVRFREQLHRDYFSGLILSTSHGVDIFSNIINALDGIEWKEDGEYGRNFKTGIKRNSKS